MALSNEMVSLAVRSSNLPERVDIDWSFNAKQVQNLIDSTSQTTIDGVVADLVRRFGSLAVYDAIGPEQLLIFRKGDLPQILAVGVHCSVRWMSTAPFGATHRFVPKRGFSL
jgi:hypothetical protein